MRGFTVPIFCIYKTKQNKTKQNKTKQNKTKTKQKRNKRKQNKTNTKVKTFCKTIHIVVHTLSIPFILETILNNLYKSRSRCPSTGERSSGVPKYKHIEYYIVIAYIRPEINCYKGDLTASKELATRIVMPVLVFNL